MGEPIYFTGSRKGTGLTTAGAFLSVVAGAGLPAIRALQPAAASKEPPVCVAGEALTITTGLTPLEKKARSALERVPNVDGAYLYRETDAEEGLTIGVIAREHGLVDRDRLLEIEDALEMAFGTPVALVVRAHQGREARALAGSNTLLFARG